jgi:hypothetical protein
VSKIKVSDIDRPAIGWHDFMPLARAEVTKFLKTQEPGKFQKDDLLGEAAIALATAKPSDIWARKAIRGALFDYVRTRDKLVSDREMGEDEYLAKTAVLDDCLPTARAARPKPCKIPSDNQIVEDWRNLHGVTVGPPPRRVRRRVRHPATGKWLELELLPSRIAASMGYRVNSKHNKVAVAPLRCAHQDGWEPTLGGMKRAKIEDDENQEHTPPSAPPIQRGDVEQSDYVEKGRQQRFSTTCHNAGRDYKSGLEPPSDLAPSRVSAFFRDGKIVRRNCVFIPKLIDERVIVTGSPPPLPSLRRTVEPPKPDITVTGKRGARAANTRKPLPRSEAYDLALREEGPREARGPRWQREAGRFQVGWGRLEIHEGKGDEYVVKERQVDGQTVWLCERLEKISSPAIDFRDYWGDIYIRGALTVSIAPPSGSGSPDLAAPPFNGIEKSGSQPAHCEISPGAALCQIDRLNARRPEVQGPPRLPAPPDTRWRPARTVIAGRCTA